ncbi:DNA polymerase alpha, subunit B, N-terminal [Sergentomyia squamirostris]
MISEEDLSREFDELGIDPNSEVLAKCSEICIAHNIEDAVKFVELWMAFSISCLGGAEPTVGKLLEFERKEIIGRKVLQKEASRQKNESGSRPGGDLLKIYSGGKREEPPREKILETYYSPKRLILVDEKGAGEHAQSGVRTKKATQRETNCFEPLNTLKNRAFSRNTLV